MNIAELLKMPIGEVDFGAGMQATITTIRKKVKSDGEWLQPVKLVDLTGTIESYIKIGVTPINRANEIRLIKGELRTSVSDENENRLYVYEYEIPSTCEPDNYPADRFRQEQELWPKRKDPDWDKIAEGKVRHGVVCAYLQGGQEPSVSDVLYWTKFIMTGIPEQRNSE